MDLISRAAWGARRTAVDVGTQPTTPIGRRTEFFVHWLGERPELRGAELMRFVQAFHIDSRGWADIGYNFAVDVDGKVYVGRGRDVVGAHCPDHNTSGIGVVVLIGKGEHPTEAALASVHQLWLECERAAGHPLAERGHRDGFQTECPGDELYRWVHSGMPVDGAPSRTPAPPSHPAAPAAPAYPGHPLALGSRGEAVRIWQQRMAHRGWRITVDGIYGPASRQVALSFQREHHLAVDGVVGPKTWAASWAAPVI